MKHFKHLVLGLSIAAASTVASASDYPTMKFELGDGSSLTFASDGLSLAFEGNVLRADHSGGVASIALDQLTKFYFVADPSGVASLNPGETQTVTVYSITGLQLGEYESVVDARKALPKGLYIFKTAQKTFKTTVE